MIEVSIDAPAGWVADAEDAARRAMRAKNPVRSDSRVHYVVQGYLAEMLVFYYLGIPLMHWEAKRERVNAGEMDGSDVPGWNLDVKSSCSWDNPRLYVQRRFWTFGRRYCLVHVVHRQGLSRPPRLALLGWASDQDVRAAPVIELPRGEMSHCLSPTELREMSTLPACGETDRCRRQ